MPHTAAEVDVPHDPRLHLFLQRVAGIGETEGEIDHQVAPGFRGGGVHALGFLHRHRHGLLAEHVQTALQRRYRQRRVKLVGHGDADAVQILGPEHRLRVGVGARYIELLLHRAQPLLIRIADGHQIRLRVAVVAPCVPTAHAETDDSHLQPAHFTRLHFSGRCATPGSDPTAARMADRSPRAGWRWYRSPAPR